MSDRKINISPKELETLVEWLDTFDSKPHQVAIIAEETGIGTYLRAEVETANGEGRWKDLSDYESW